VIMERMRAALTVTTAPTPADSADSAEKAQSRGLQSPQVPAGACGKPPAPCGIRTFPQAPADYTGPVVSCFPHNPQNPQPMLARSDETAPACTLEWLRGQGCNVLPEDVRFIEPRLPRGTRRRRAVLWAYVSAWLDAMERERLEHRRDNQGRLIANTRLREGRLTQHALPPTSSDDERSP